MSPSITPSRDKDGKVERGLKLEGDKFQRVVEVLRNTRIKERSAGGQPAGGRAFNVTFKDEKGKSVTGASSNRDQWEKLAAQVRET